MPLREPARTVKSVWIIAIVAAVLQVALSPQISIAGGTVNFMMVLAFTLALSSEAGSAAIIGFACGLFYDMTSAAPVGLMALILCFASFVIASSARGALGGLTRDSIRLVVVATFAANLFYGFCLFLLGAQTNLLWALLGHGLSSTVLNSLVSLAFLAILGGASTQRGFTARTKSSRYKIPR